MKKSEIQFHSAGFGRQSHPAVKVKCYNFARGLDVAAEFKCDEATAERALEFAWKSECEDFWEQAQELAEYNLGPGVTIYSEGRSSGWLVVHGLPDVETWDAIAVNRWFRFVRGVEADIAYRTSATNVREAIAANRWAEPDAEAYNFVYTADGQTLCIADLKAKAREAGFGPVVRS